MKKNQTGKRKITWGIGPGSGLSKCKGPEAGVCLVCLRNSKTTVAGAEQTGKEKGLGKVIQRRASGTQAERYTEARSCR